MRRPWWRKQAAALFQTARKLRVRVGKYEPAQRLVADSPGTTFSMIARDEDGLPVVGEYFQAVPRVNSFRAELHVLDVGSGSGLLAMMSVRAGADRVSSLEMVPAMAAVARYIVKQTPKEKKAA